MWSRRVRGLYATKSRIIGVQFGWEWEYLTISWGPFIAAIGVAIGIYAAAIYSTNGYPTGITFWLLLMNFVPLLGIIATTSSASIVEMRLKHRKPLTMEEVQLKRYFEARKDQISEIVMQKGTTLSPGFLMINLRTGMPIRISIFNSFTNSGKRFYELKQLIESFCMKPVAIRAPNLFAWALQ